jgi:hypothetical protein
MCESLIYIGGVSFKTDETCLDGEYNLKWRKRQGHLSEGIVAWSSLIKGIRPWMILSQFTDQYGNSLVSKKK